MADKYKNFAELAIAESNGAWRITHIDRPISEVLVVAPHAGGIEPFTTAVTSAIAGSDYSLYCFEGLKPKGNTDLHITSHHFDEPLALSLAAQSSIVLAIHGCAGDSAIYVGGLDNVLVDLPTARLGAEDLPAASTGHKYLAIEPNNICNLSKRKCGAQLEITSDFRENEMTRARIVGAAKEIIAKHLLTTVSQ